MELFIESSGLYNDLDEGKQKSNSEENKPNEHLIIIQRYFRYHYSSFNKIMKDTEKLKKFIEKWNTSSALFCRKESESLNLKKNNESLKSKANVSLSKRNTITANVNQEKENKSIDEKLTKTVKRKISTNISGKVSDSSAKDQKKDNSKREMKSSRESREKKNSVNRKSLKINDTNNLQSSNNGKSISKENKLGSKVFICHSTYPDIKQALINRGWVENVDQKSLDFNFLWSLKTKEIPLRLNHHQIVNHYTNNIEITKKSGLTKNIKNLIFKNIDVDNFYPRCYDLSEKNEMEDFLEDFKTTKAFSILKRFQTEYPDYKTMTKEKLNTSCEILERKLNFLELKLDSTERFNDKLNIDSDLRQLLTENEIKLISNNEWYTISEEDKKIYLKELEKLERMNKIGIYEKKFSRSKSVIAPNTKITTEEISDRPKSEAPVTYDLEKYKPLVDSILTRMKQYYPQFTISGDKNIWILKPSGLSRGRGITCINNLNEILQFLKTNSNQYMAQKYIENPLIILGRKFDIRQWVLVTNMDPLTVWMYDTPYLRFGAEDYKPEDFSNLFSHLTNNSVVKYSKNFTNEKIQGNMWEIEIFAEYLEKIYGRNVWKEELQPKIKKIIISSLESVKKVIKNRNNTFELFGYDIMIDEHLNTWLIEVNSSPAMDYSTHVTEFLVKQMSEDLIKVVIDHNKAGPNERENISTGRFIKIHSGEDILSPEYIPNYLN